MTLSIPYQRMRKKKYSVEHISNTGTVILLKDGIGGHMFSS